MDTLMQSIALCDEVRIYPRNDALCTSNITGDNALKAAKLCCEKFGVNGIDIITTKHIPYGGGLGGSSADTAAVISGIGELYGIDKGELYSATATIYADLSFQLIGGTARCTGRGEILQRLPALPRFHVLIAAAEGGSDTAAVYRAYDVMGIAPPVADTMAVYHALMHGDCAEGMAVNHLTAPACSLNPSIGDVMRLMQDTRAMLSSMSGSGSCVFNLYKHRKDAEAKKAELTLPTILTETIAFD